MNDAQVGQSETPKKRRILKWEKAFIAALADSGVVAHACAAAKTGRQATYHHRAAHEDFAQAWDEALEVASDALELEARRRAHDGVEEPIHYKGVQVDTVRKYSDTLLMFLLKGARPEKFRETFDHTLHGPNNGAIQIQAFESEMQKVYGDNGAPAE